MLSSLRIPLYWGLKGMVYVHFAVWKMMDIHNSDAFVCLPLHPNVLPDCTTRAGPWPGPSEAQRHGRFRWKKLCVTGIELHIISEQLCLTLPPFLRLYCLIHSAHYLLDARARPIRHPSYPSLLCVFTPKASLHEHRLSLCHVFPFCSCPIKSF